MIQIQQSGFKEDGIDLRRMKHDFEKRKCIRLPKFIEKRLLKFLLNQVANSSFEPAKYSVGSELTTAQSVASTALSFLLNDRTFFDFLSELTNCGRIGWFGGRLYRMVPDCNQKFDWHDDDFDFRMLGLSINLSEQKFSGGKFQLRSAQSGTILVDYKNYGPGDALLFQISRDLEHRVTPMSGLYPKTTFSGWFRSHPDYEELMRLAARQQKETKTP